MPASRSELFARSKVAFISLIRFPQERHRDGAAWRGILTGSPITDILMPGGPLMKIKRELGDQFRNLLIGTSRLPGYEHSRHRKETAQ
jgi:hypothetical protein